MLAGVTIVDPRTAWIDPGSPSSRTLLFTRSRCSAARPRSPPAAEIGPHAVAIDASVGEGAIVGPFCYLRPGTVLEAGAKAGTFVEIKQSRIGAGAKVPHLSYIGDADIGEDTNIAAGNVTANFSHEPGRPKGKHHDRQERQDRCRQYVRCSGHGWRRCLALVGNGRHGRRPAGFARGLPPKAGHQGRVGLRAWTA